MRRTIEKIKYVNIYLCPSVCHMVSRKLESQWRMLCAHSVVFFFFLSWFYVPAPPLCPSLLFLLTVHNLIKGQPHSIMIRVMVPLPDSPDSSLCARKPLPC